MSAAAILLNGGIVVAVVAVVAGSQVLSAALLAAPLMSMAVLSAALRPGLAAQVIAGGLLLGLLLPWLQGLALARRYHGHAVWWSVALRGWCCSGVVLACPGSYLLLARLAPGLVHPWTHAAPWLALQAAVVLLVLPPLANLYVQQITAADAPQVLAHAITSDLVLHGYDGVRLQARYYRPRCVAQPRGLVVFTHGFGGWKEGFLNHLTLCTRSGWAVLAYDLRGHGRSQPGAVSFGGREQEDLVALWSQAQRLAAGAPVVAYGVSMGAVVVLLAGNRLAGCAGLVVESPFGDLARLMRHALPGPISWCGRTLGRCAGLALTRIVPQAAPVLASGPPLLIGWIADDQTIPAAESASVAAQAPRARTLVMAHGEHLDTITWLPWRQAVIGLLAEFAPRTGYDGEVA